MTAPQLTLEQMMALQSGGGLPVPPPPPPPPVHPYADLRALGYTAEALAAYTPEQLAWLRANAPGAGGQPTAGINSPEATAAPSLAAADPAPVKADGAKTKAVLEAECVARGITVPKGAKKADLEALLAAPAATPSAIVPFSGPHVPVNAASLTAAAGPTEGFFSALASLRAAASACDLVVDVTIRNL